MRREFPAKVRAAAFDRSGGHCEKCTAFLYTGKFAYDHIIADSIGGEPTLSNCAVLCDNCHDEKTAKLDTPRAAKTKRQHSKHIGARPRSRMPGSRASGLKKRMDGTVERRSTPVSR